MHNIDPHANPILPVTVTPVVDPTTGPVTPVMSPELGQPTYQRPFNPLPYIAVLLLSVIGIWGLMSLDRRDDDVAAPTNVAYVEQGLEPSARPMSPSALSTTAAYRARVNEDVSRDNMRALREEQMATATEADRLGETAVTTSPIVDPYDNEVANVDLSYDRRDTAPKPSTEAKSVMDLPAPAINVLDLNYSEQPMVALSQQDLKNSMGKLESELDKAEDMAKQTDQVAAHEILEKRFDALEDSAEAKGAPMTQVDRLQLTREMAELRDELSAFQRDLSGLVSQR